MDARGLVALWREALLAQAVLIGRTRGYTRHPQLARFRRSASPPDTIAHYLRAIYAESFRRGYCFDPARLGPAGSVQPLAATRGQFDYEWFHLKAKHSVRAPEWLAGLKPASSPKAHPLFRIVPGPVADWEVSKANDAIGRKPPVKRLA
jgi:hypothetical protein